jgi:hypothetical protein
MRSWALGLERFLTAASMKITLFRIVAPCSRQGDRPDDGGSKHLWNVGKLIPDYTAQQPTRQSSSTVGLKKSRKFLNQLPTTGLQFWTMKYLVTDRYTPFYRSIERPVLWHDVLLFLVGDHLSLSHNSVVLIEQHVSANMAIFRLTYMFFKLLHCGHYSIYIDIYRCCQLKR